MQLRKERGLDLALAQNRVTRHGKVRAECRAPILPVRKLRPREVR